jgi:hypothetical protein
LRMGQIGLSRNVGKKLPFCTAWNPKRAQISHHGGSLQSHKTVGSSNLARKKTPRWTYNSEFSRISNFSFTIYISILMTRNIKRTTPF